MAETVLVTETEFGKGEGIFAAAEDLAIIAVPADERRLADEVSARGARAIIVGAAPYRGPLYAALGHAAGSRGAIIARFGVGCDGIDMALAQQHAIAVANTPGALDASVAEHTIWLLGSLARRIPAAGAHLRAGVFRADAGVELSGKILGVIGFGAIGRRVARMASAGLGMRVFAAGRRSAADLARDEKTSIEEIRAAYGLALYTNDADAVLLESDGVTLHLAARPETHNFIDARRLALMKRGAFLINTARGSLVDELALYNALEGGRLGGAGLDVFRREPYEPQLPDRDLRTLENAVLTPHIGSNTREANARMAQATLANVRHFLAGRLDAVTRVDR
ncbi:MAG: hypothetical protein JXP34_22185 [Planctomycetes bacterium]|nr:hypothetical protein [Planctomycetota bacterium]